MALSVLGSGCGLFTEPQTLAVIEGTQPRQIRLASGPRIIRVPDSAVVVVEVTAPDSTLHRAWVPSTVTIATSRGFSGQLLLRPHACLDPASDSGAAFPFSFSWLACDRVGLVSQSVLSDSQLRDIERALSGSLALTFVFRSRPGAQYEFFVPVGKQSTAEALRRLRSLRPQDEVYHPTNEPPCLTSDVIPPPPCPPWTLVVRQPFSFGPITADSLPIEAGGWIEVRYQESDGKVGVVRISVDQL